MGVLVSPAPRSTAPKIIDAARNSMGVYKTKKYVAAVLRISGSTCIRTGTMGERASVRTVNKIPDTSTASTACAEARRQRSGSFAPIARAIYERKPTPRADSELPTNQPTVLVEPTAADACVPSEPTMAVSTYCTAVCISCSSMVGNAKEITVGNSPHFIFPKNLLFIKTLHIQTVTIIS